jgi:hypothetical protein
MFSFATLHHAERLKARAIAFIKANAAAVTKTEGWCDLCRSNPELVGDLYTNARLAAMQCSSSSRRSRFVSLKRRRTH